jgi:hypothetical protein
MRALVAIGLVTSCVSSGKVECDDGRICPPGYTCDDALHRCISPEQQAACVGLADGDACSFSGAQGTCHAGSCDPLLCGDGLATGTEVCDGDDLRGATCTDAGFYAPDGLRCTQFCTFDTSGCAGFCGDGIVNGPEQCDGTPPAGTCAGEGFDAGPLGCGATCGESFAECARFGWRSEPLAGLHALAIAGTSRSDTWVVGDAGRIAHFDGGAWTEVDSTVTNSLVSVWAVAPGDAWAVGLGPNVGDPGIVLHRTAAGWADAHAPTAKHHAVWAADATHVYVTTEDAEVLRWNGATWDTLAGPGGALDRITGTSSTDIWVTKLDQTLWHYTGSTWTPATLAVLANDVLAVAPNDVWVAGMTPGFVSLVAHYDGMTWQTWLRPDNQNVTSIGASAATNDVWVATSTGDALHYDGVAWTRTRATVDGQGFALKMYGPNETVGASYSGVAYRYRGQAWGRQSDGASSSGRAMWSDRADDVYAASLRGVFHYDGHVWSQALPLAVGNAPVSVWGSGPLDVYVLTASTLYHYSGTTWPTVTAPSGALQLVWGTSASDVWVMSSDGAFHGPGTWTPYVGAGAGWVSISGSAANDVWAIRGGTELWHWNGATWTTHAIPAMDLIAVTARSESDVWVTAKGNRMLHFDGAAWTDMPLPTSSDMQWIAATAGDDVFAASPLEMIHYDGTRWSPVHLDIDAFNDNIAAMYVPSANRVELLYTSFPNQVRELIRTVPWVCRAHETACDDAIDDDCDGLVDHLDPDCP